MRQIVLDTETTGLEIALGHRVIEIGCVELVNRRSTGRNFHRYLHPERDIDAGAAAVHGITLEFLQDKPRFVEIAEELLEFIAGAELIIHNAAFDVAFLEKELERCFAHERYLGRTESPLVRRIAGHCRILDSLLLAREMHPGQRNSLDALCKRYAIDASHRELHGALLDARILADVYLAMTGGQSALALDEAGRGSQREQREQRVAPIHPGIPLLIIEPTEAERIAHAALLEVIDKASAGRCIWNAVRAGSGH
jgi:DNA polymerase-3 subunit epsilon